MKIQRTVRAILSTGRFQNPERKARKEILKKLGISNKKFKRINKKARHTGEGFHFQYDSQKKVYTGKKSE